MTEYSRQKQKLLFMKQLFETQSDEKHTFTGNKLIDLLEQNGIKAERKTIYDDIKTLMNSGMDIVTVKEGHSNAYYLGERLFQTEELFVLADAVASCRFLTQKKSKDLIKKLQSLTSEYNSKELKRQIYVDNRTKTFNEKIYYNINYIQDAIFSDRQISFKYFEYAVTGRKQQLRHNGEIYVVSPFQLVWENDNYYLVCYCQKHNDISRFRVDRMNSVSVIMSEPRKELTEEEEEQVENQQRLFGMYSGESAEVKIQFHNSLVNAVVDKFGVNVIRHPDSDDTFYITETVNIAPTFWGWLFQFGNQAKVLGPNSVIEKVKLAADEISKLYK